MLRSADPEAAGAVEVIKRRSRGLMDFVERYRAIAELPAPRPQSLGLGSFLSDIDRLLAPTFQEKRIVCRASVEPPDITVEADPQLLAQAVINLLRNAADAVSADGAIAIRLDRERRYDGSSLARLSVTDNGPGIPNDVRERIFEPFFSTKERGVGLGLATVLRIVEAHGGSIEVDNPPAGGSRFTVWLPGVVS